MKARVKNKINNLGFMLAELLVVIAILAILAGVSFVSVSSYIRGLQALEMDETAKEIFIAAQNHLSSAYASGEYGIAIKDAPESSEEFGDVLNELPDELKKTIGNGADDNVYRVINHKAGDANKQILNYMLPLHSIDSEISEQGEYMIVYEVKSATVIAVFYSGNPHTSFGGKYIYRDFETSMLEGDGDEDIVNAITYKNTRKNFKDDYVIGVFSGNNKDIIPGADLDPLILEIKNGNILKATVTSSNFTKYEDQVLDIYIYGKTSENTQQIHREFGVLDVDQISIDIDNITNGYGFYQQFGKGDSPLIPGEDIEVYATYFLSDHFASSIKSNIDTDNSLFCDYINNDSNISTAIIQNIRHLENLDPDISKFDLTAIDSSTNKVIAEQIKDIDYNDFISEVNSYAPPIYNAQGSQITTNYYGISNNALIKYDGTNNYISNVISTYGDGGNSGIFGTVNLADENETFTIKNLDIFDSSFGSEDLTGSAGSAIGSASSSVELQNVTIKSSGSNAISIKGNMGGVEGAGGLIGKTTDSLTVIRSTVSSDNLSILGNNSGGIVGYAEAACTITDSSVEGKDFNPIGNTSGGIVGKSDTSLTISKCHVSGENLNIAGNVAGGIAGLTTGKVDIKDTYSTAYVYADVEPGGNTGGGIAGGFIGSVDSPTSDSIIERCYVSGHTKNKNYAAGTQSSRETASHVDNFNIIANGITGGFIGHSDAIAVKNSYTTASVYSSNYKNLTGSKIAGGFVGTCVNLSVDNVYSAGLVSVTDGGTVGGFAGTGTISATGSNYYLRGKDSVGNGFNDIPAMGSGGTLTGTGVSETAGTEISVTTAATAEPWDTELPKTYTYKTVAQLSGDNNSLKKHVGDWVVVTEDDSQKGIFIRNAETLSVVFKGKSYSNTDISILVEGLYSKKTAFAMYNFNNSEISQYTSAQAKDKISSAGGNINEKIQVDSNSTADTPEMINPKRDLNALAKPVDDEFEYYIYLDDITTPERVFDEIFDTLTPGEDIRITAMAGVHSWGDLKRAQSSGSSSAMIGITNSLFADGSNNANYKSSDYYSDINPKHAIVDPVDNQPSAYSSTALITNFRHLQNLDTTISDIGDEAIKITKARLCKDLYWTSSKVNGDITVNEIPKAESEDEEQLVDFITAINNSKGIEDPLKFQEVKIYGEDSDDEDDALSVDNSFYGIENDDLIEFDGQNHTINNVFISNVKGDNAGLFRNIETGTKTMSIHDFKLVEPVVFTTGVNVGGLVGMINEKSSSTGRVNISNVYIYGKYALVKTTNSSGNAGGLFGQGITGSYYINNCGASCYVYASGDKCSAGGFIGGFKPKSTVEITDCFVGGHVAGSNISDTSVGTYYPDYVDDVAVTVDGNSTNISCEGGYNVYGGIAVGGFVGYIGTASNNTTTTFERCFSTASVNSPSANDQTANVNKRTVGGFIGRSQSTGQKYNNCYVEGRVYNNANLTGYFVGHAYEKNSSMATFTGDLILKGIDFNDDQNINIVNTDTISIATASSGISYAEYNSANLINENASNVRVKTFNLAAARGVSDEYIEFPYKVTARDSKSVVFFGDWVEAQPTQMVKVKNGNRLEADITLNYYTRTVQKDSNGYYTTYIRVVGQTSGATSYFRVRYKSATDVIVERMVNAEWTPAFSLADPGVVKYEPTKALLTFYIDNISNYGYNYAGIMGYNGPTCIPGEPVTVYASSSIHDSDKVKGVMNNDSSHDSAVSSLFEKLEKNSEIDSTYTAYVANSRHLENLNPAISRLSSNNYKITKVVLTDNIYWQDNGTYGGTGYNASTAPYLTELPNSYICYDSQGGTTFQEDLNSFMPLITSTSAGTYITEFDGQNKVLYNFIIGNNSRNTANNIGLFGQADNELTIRNLNFNSATVTSSNTTDNGALLVGYSSNNLNIDNVEVIGKVTLDRKALMGVAAGKAKTLSVNNLRIKADLDIGKSQFTAFAGGIAGYVNDNLTVNNSYIHNSALTVNAFGECSAGGMAGRVDKNFNLTNSYINSGALNISSVYAAGNHYVGGLTGYVGGDATIDSAQFITASGNITSGSGNDYAGGYIGYANAATIIRNSSITGSALNIETNGLSKMYSGGFVGFANTELTLTNMKIDFTGGTFTVNSTGTARKGYSGGLAGHIQNKLTCSNSEVVGTNINIKGNYITGGLFASIYVYGKINDSCIHGKTVNISGDFFIGGIIGSLSGTGEYAKLYVDNVYVYSVNHEGHVKLNNDGGNSLIGGFIARTFRTDYFNINNSFSSIVVEANGTGAILGAGGFGGYFDIVEGGSGVITKCYSSSHYDSQYDVASNYGRTGGFAGSITGNITLSQCFTTNVVYGTGTSDVGGFAGMVGKGAKIKDTCYTVGTVKGTGSAIGQFAGRISGTEPQISGLSNANISDAYYIDKYRGGIASVGVNEAGVSYYIHKETAPGYSNIMGFDSTLAANTHVWAGSSVPTNAHYKFKIWSSDRQFYGEWDYRNLPSS